MYTLHTALCYVRSIGSFRALALPPPPLLYLLLRCCC